MSRGLDLKTLDERALPELKEFNQGIPVVVHVADNVLDRAGLIDPPVTSQLIGKLMDQLVLWALPLHLVLYVLFTTGK